QVAEAEAVAAELSELIAQPVDVFPPGSEETELESLAHQETAQRLHVLSRLYKFNTEGTQGTCDRQGVPILTTTLPALLHSVPSPDSLEGDKQVLVCGKRVDLIALRKWLMQSGYHSTSSVQLPGEFAVRGGILDIYPPDEPLPIRVELFDDEIESLRSFDVVSQRSIEQRDQLQLLAVQGSVAQDGSLLDYFPDDTLVVVFEQASIMAAGQMFLQRVPFPERFASPETLWQRLLKHHTVLVSQLADEGYLGELQRLPLGNVERIGGDLEKLSQDIDQHVGVRQVIVVAMNDGERDRLQELLASATATQERRLTVVVSQLLNGFEILPAGMFVLTAGQLLRRSHVRRAT
ncbi:MAG: hypothetical protein KDA51_01825, partial [Planctomycetales bacterium]|nr:hypothetical protein [Planctomycetales bacterium]